ncbi:MAG TPA: hypothetical protein VGS80_26865, partial [Ktedonobacterales bacterium]|nr:hypothetical protein [Ktedonobacterales bacterium]
GQTSALVCSTDGGQTWSERPLLMLPFDNQGGKSLGPTTAPAYPNAIADDGAIFATAASAQLPDSTFVGCTLYRLVPGATEWQSLGPAPAFQAYYASAPANGLLWEIRSDTTSASTDRLYTPFTAAYP